MPQTTIRLHSISDLSDEEKKKYERCTNLSDGIHTISIRVSQTTTTTTTSTKSKTVTETTTTTSATTPIYKDGDHLAVDMTSKKLKDDAYKLYLKKDGDFFIIKSSEDDKAAHLCVDSDELKFNSGSNAPAAAEWSIRQKSGETTYVIFSSDEKKEWHYDSDSVSTNSTSVVENTIWNQWVIKGSS